MINYQFIRGERIIQFLQETPYMDLERNIVTGFPGTTKRQHAVDPVQIVQLNLFPSVQSKTLIARALARSGAKKYSPEVMLLSVEYQPEDTPDNITFKANDGDDYHIAPVDLRQNDCKVRCDCLDFYFRFAYWNHNDGSLYGGAPPRYVRKTANRPPVNPARVPGICKHVIKCMMALSEAGLVTNV